MSREWKSKSQLGEVWNPKQDANGAPKFVAEVDDYIDGVYMDRKDGIGQYNSTVYNIKGEGGKMYAVWGDTVLNGEMNKYKFGTFLRIKFAGRKRKKDVKETVAITDKNSFWNWEVMYDASQSGGEVSAADVNDAISAPSLAPNTTSAMAPPAGDDDLPF